MAEEVIDDLPGGYDQLIGRRFKQGVDLSGGQWQKIAIARAWMRNAQVMILDEPTAALDARSEFEVFQRFRELADNRTAVLISHRFPRYAWPIASWCWPMAGSRPAAPTPS
jgi:ATP-binding cassette subfamily B protein